MIGQIISHYRIVERLGVGGMGAVYRAHDEQLDRDVALKLLNPGVLTTEDSRRRFLAEAQFLAKLNHPCIEMVFELGKFGEQDFIVLEYIPGRTLAAILADGPMPEEKILRLGIMLATGLEAAHACGLLHRDLKPSNLILTKEDRLKILDFGLAMSLPSAAPVAGENHLQSKQSLVGTLPYVAPEQLRGAPCDVRSDIYSVGAVLYEMATGELPFTDDNALELTDSILHETPPTPRALSPNISPYLEAIILKALQKDPSDRHQTAAELRAELERVAAGEAKSARPFDQSQAPVLEMAYVLFTDIVGYSRLATDTQQNVLRQLQRIVRGTADFQRSQQENRLIRLPTGDGMALAFFVDPEAPVRCAVEISRALRTHPEINLRMGMHVGPVYRVTDINGNQNVAGEGINVAQRVMDVGDEGHILVSKPFGDVLRHLTGWQGALKDLGEVTVKHGLRISVFNLLIDDAGNPAMPKKVEEQRKLSPGVSFFSKRRLAIAATAALAAAVLVLTLFRNDFFVVQARRPKIAVLGFRNLTAAAENDWVSTSLESMLSSELSEGDHVVTVPAETVSIAKVDLALPSADTYAPETLLRIRKRLDCDYVVYGSYFDTGKAAGGRLQVQVHMQKTASGETLVNAPESGSELAVQDLAAGMGATLRGRLGLPGINMSESAEFQASVPSTPEARRFYAEGLAHLYRFDLLSAKSSLEKAISADPNFSLAHAELAEVWKGLGYDEKARSEAKTALDLSSHLGNEFRTLVKARYHEMASEWDTAIDLYRSLWIVGREQTPEYAYRAADVQIRAGKATDALAMVSALRKVPGLREDPRVDLREAEAYESLGDFRKQSAAAKQAATKAHSTGARLLEAEALWRVCDSLANLGEAAGARAACQRSIEVARATANFMLLARSLSILGNISAAQGDPAQALDFHHQALAFVRRIGSRRDVAGALTNIGNIFSVQANHPEAQKAYLEALAEAREINDRAAILLLQNDLAADLQTTGDLARSLMLYQQSLETARAIGDKAGAARAQNNIGMIYSLQGNFSAALPSIQEAIRTVQPLGLKSDYAAFLYNLGDAEVSQGDLDGAKRDYQDGRDAATQAGDKTLIAQGQLCLSGLSLENGNTLQAQGLAEQAEQEFHTSGMKDLESAARNLIASSLLQENRIPDARKELDSIGQLAPQDPTVRLAVAITSERLEIRGGRTNQAKNELDRIVAEAKKIGIPSLQFEARLAHGEMGLFGGDRNTAIAILAKLEKDARVKGYLQIAARAKRTARKINS